MNMTPQQLNRLLKESADKMTALYDEIKKLKNETADYESRLYRLNEQHVEDLLARQELLEALAILERPDKQLELTPSGYFIFRLKRKDVEQIAAATQKWSQK